MCVYVFTKYVSYHRWLAPQLMFHPLVAWPRLFVGILIVVSGFVEHGLHAPDGARSAAGLVSGQAVLRRCGCGEHRCCVSFRFPFFFYDLPLFNPLVLVLVLCFFLRSPLFNPLVLLLFFMGFFPFATLIMKPAAFAENKQKKLLMV